MALPSGKNGRSAQRRDWNTSSLREHSPCCLGFDVISTIVTFRYENGINTFDTADVYSNVESERILGIALKVHNIPRENVVIMTKVCIFPGRTARIIYSRGPHRYSARFGKMTVQLLWWERTTLVMLTAMDSPTR